MAKSSTSAKKKAATKSGGRKAEGKAPKGAAGHKRGAGSAQGADAPAGAKPGKRAKASVEKKPKRVSLLDAAAIVLKDAKAPMNPRAIIEQVAAKRLWAPARGGRTPHASLAAAMAREIAAKGAASRFRKAGRGVFGATKVT